MPNFQLSPEQLRDRLLGSRQPLTAIDVRSEAEQLRGIIPEARLVPLAQLQERLVALVQKTNQALCFICETGKRSKQAMELAQKLGYHQTMELAGGMQAWRERGFRTTQADFPDGAMIERYQRQIALPDFGLTGQRALQSARVLVIGAGGLGSPVLLYLASSGIGHIGIIDPDVVETHNLHRQIVHSESNVGISKVASAASQLRQMRSDLQLTCFEQAFCRENADDLIASYDIVVDCTDRLQTRYLANDVCLQQGKPFVYGAIYRHEGQVAVFSGPKPGAKSEDGACYRCLFPNEPDESQVPNCSLAGVLGPMPGVIGCLQAMEVIKLAANLGQPLSGRLIVFDSLTGEQRLFQLQRDPLCRCQQFPQTPPTARVDG